MTVRRIEVGGARPYVVEVGSGLLGQVRVPESQVALIHPADLPRAFVETVQARLSPCVTVEVPLRDECKTLDVFAGVLSRLAQAGLPRSGAVVGLGGGAATDLAGFVAASYLRGVGPAAPPPRHPPGLPCPAPVFHVRRLMLYPLLPVLGPHVSAPFRR